MLNSYDIHRLLAIIARTVPHKAIRYILGATGEGGHQLHLNPAFQLSYIDYMFIANNEGVRAWLLSNRVLENPFDLLVYCHRRRLGRARLLRPSEDTTIFMEMPSPIGLCMWRDVMAFRPHEVMWELTPAQPMPWVKRQTTHRLVIQDQAVHHRLSLTPARDAKQAWEHYHPRLEIPANPPLFVYHSESNRYPK